MNDELCAPIDDRLAGQGTRTRGAVRFRLRDVYRTRLTSTPLSVSSPINLSPTALRNRKERRCDGSAASR